MIWVQSKVCNSYFNWIEFIINVFADKATNQLNTETDWGLILALSDKISSTANG